MEGAGLENDMPAKPRIADFPGVMLAHGYDPGKHDPTGWLASEKLDGVRAIWNGTMFLTRTAVQIFAPEWFTRNLPHNTILDGELFMGRGKFQRTSGAVRRNNVAHPDWKEIEYHVFDMPRHKSECLYDRLSAVCPLIRDCKSAVIVIQQPIENRNHLNEMLRAVLARGGEGLIIRHPRGRWIATRSNEMLKVKVQDDMDAVVVGYTPGEGKHTGRVGALECKEWRCGPGSPRPEELASFNCGTGLTDEDRNHPPEIGSLIRVGHHGLTDAGLPRFPSFLGVRIEKAEMDEKALASAVLKAGNQKVRAD